MIHLKEIDKHNYMDAIFLKTKENQRNFVADNATSLAEAKYEEGLYVRGIYNDETMIGFALFDYDTEIPGWSLSRYMIDEKYQAKGYGE